MPQVVAESDVYDELPLHVLQMTRLLLDVLVSTAAPCPDLEPKRRQEQWAREE